MAVEKRNVFQRFTGMFTAEGRRKNAEYRFGKAIEKNYNGLSDSEKEDYEKFNEKGLVDAIVKKVVEEKKLGQFVWANDSGSIRRAAELTVEELTKMDREKQDEGELLILPNTKKEMNKFINKMASTINEQVKWVGAKRVGKIALATVAVAGVATGATKIASSLDTMNVDSGKNAEQKDREEVKKLKEEIERLEKENEKLKQMEKKLEDLQKQIAELGGEKTVENDALKEKLEKVESFKEYLNSSKDDFDKNASKLGNFTTEIYNRYQNVCDEAIKNLSEGKDYNFEEHLEFSDLLQGDEGVNLKKAIREAYVEGRIADGSKYSKTELGKQFDDIYKNGYRAGVELFNSETGEFNKEFIESVKSGTSFEVHLVEYKEETKNLSFDKAKEEKNITHDVVSVNGDLSRFVQKAPTQPSKPSTPTTPTTPTEPGCDCDQDKIKELEEKIKEIEEKIEEIEPGKDGKDGAPGKDGKDGTPGRDGYDGRDGSTVILRPGDDHVDQGGKQPGDDHVDQGGSQPGDDHVEQGGKNPGNDGVEQGGGSSQPGDDRVYQGGQPGDDAAGQQPGDGAGQGGQQPGNDGVEQGGVPDYSSGGTPGNDVVIGTPIVEDIPVIGVPVPGNDQIE